MVRRTERVSGASLNFYENQRHGAAIAADQVDFATPLGAKILVQNAIAIFLQVFCGDSLSLLSESKVGRNVAATELSQPTPGKAASLQSIYLFKDSRQSGNRSERPEQTIGDGSGMDHESEVSRYAPVFHNLYSREIRSGDTRYAIHASYGPE